MMIAHEIETETRGIGIGIAIGLATAVNLLVVLVRLCAMCALSILQRDLGLRQAVQRIGVLVPTPVHHHLADIRLGTAIATRGTRGILEIRGTPRGCDVVDS